MKKITVVLIIFLLLVTECLSLATVDTEPETELSLRLISLQNNSNKFIENQLRQYYNIIKMNPIFIWGNDLPGRSDPFFEMTNIKKFGQTVYGIATVDFNGDDHLDFIASWREENSYLGGVTVFINQGNTVFSEELLMSNEDLSIDPIKDDEIIPTIDDLEAADFDNDGDIDLFLTSNEYASQGGPILTNGTGFIIFNDGTNHFGNCTPVFVHTPITTPREEKRIHPEITTADYDNDGDIDFLVGDNSGLVELYLNDGTGKFHSQSRSDFGGTDSWGVTSADYDNDGDIDFIVTQSDSVAEGRLCLKYNDGTNTCFDHDNWIKISDIPTMESYFASLSGFPQGTLCTIDYNDDNAMDLLFGGPGNIMLFIQQGNQNFVPFTAGRLPAIAIKNIGWHSDDLRLGGISVGDFNNDGNDDVVVGGIQGFIRLFINQVALIDIVFPDFCGIIMENNPKFVTIPIYSFLKQGTSIAIGDLTVKTKELEPLSRVDFYLDEKLMLSDDDPPFEWEWTRFSLGPHTVKAQAYDLEGNNAGFDTTKVWKFL